MAVFDPRRAYQYFHDRYGIAQSTGKGWYEFDCPFCAGVRKRAVHLGYGITKCWTCSFRGHIYEFMQEVEDCTYQEAKELLWNVEPSVITTTLLEKEIGGITRSSVELPIGFKSILDGNTMLAHRARTYLRGRGFDLSKLDMKGYGYCNMHVEDRENDNTKDFFGYIIIPYKREGELKYYIGRDYIGNFLRYKNPPVEYVGVGKNEVIYNEEALYLHDEVIIVEGALDAETWGDEGTATSGWHLSPYQKNKYMRSSAKTLVFIPDAGEDGEGVSFYYKGVQAARDFLDFGKTIYVLDLNLISDKGKDINKIGRQPVYDLYKKTTPLTWSTANNIIMSLKPKNRYGGKLQ